MPYTTKEAAPASEPQVIHADAQRLVDLEGELALTETQIRQQVVAGVQITGLQRKRESLQREIADLQEVIALNPFAERERTQAQLRANVDAAIERRRENHEQVEAAKARVRDLAAQLDAAEKEAFVLANSGGGGLQPALDKLNHHIDRYGDLSGAA